MLLLVTLWGPPSRKTNSRFTALLQHYYQLPLHVMLRVQTCEQWLIQIEKMSRNARTFIFELTQKKSSEGSPQPNRAGLIRAFDTNQ